MSNAADEHSQPARYRRPRLVGYFNSKRRINRLRRFQDLLRHRERWPDQLRLARPLEELIGQIEENDRQLVIDREINRLILPLWHNCDDLGLPIIVEYEHEETAIESGGLITRKKPRKYDLIGDYDTLLKVTGPQRRDTLTLILARTDNAIGAYEAFVAHARWDFINPFAWCAHLLNAFAYVLERAGVSQGQQAGDKALGTAAVLIGLLLVAALLLLCVRLGITIPWRDILTSLLKHV